MLQTDAVKAANTAGDAAGSGFGARFKTAIGKLDIGGALAGAFSVAGGLALFQGITGGIRGVVDTLGGLVKAGADGEAADARLIAAFKANAPGWEAHTAEVEAAVTAGQKLGFLDDDVKGSLALLVLHTHNVTDAVTLQKAAFDLARLKGIDLATASVAVGKAFDGNTTALKRMGIELPKGAKGFEAIAALEQAAGGQAQAFADTGAGAAAALNASLAGLQEKIGRDLLPVFKGLVDFIAGPVVDAVTAAMNGIGNLGTAFDNLHRVIDPNYALMQDTNTELRKQAEALGIDADKFIAWSAAQDQAAASQVAATKAGHLQELQNEILAANAANQTVNLGALIDKYAQYGISVGEVTQLNSDLAGKTTAAAVATGTNAAAADAAHQKLLAYAIAMGDVKKATELGGQAAGDAAAAMARLPRAFGGAGTAIQTATPTIVHAFNHVQSAAKSMKTNVIESFDLMQGGVLGALKQAVTDAGTQLTALWYEIKHPGELKTNRDALAGQMRDAQAALLAAEKGGDANVIADAQALVASLQAEWDKLNATITLNARIDYYNQNRHPLLGGGAASGGPRPAGWTGLVGEEGTEMLTLLPGGGAYVTSHADLMSNLHRAASPSFPSLDFNDGRATIHHTFGPIHVDAPNMSPAAAGALGLGLANGLVAGLQMRLGTNG